MVSAIPYAPFTESSGKPNSLNLLVNSLITEALIGSAPFDIYLQQDKSKESFNESAILFILQSSKAKFVAGVMLPLYLLMALIHNRGDLIKSSCDIKTELQPSLIASNIPLISPISW